MGVIKAGRTARTVLAALAALVLAGVPASAGQGFPWGESVHADSYGNLVIHSPAGYKRILVGKGHLVDQYASRTAAPRVVYLDEEVLYLRPAEPRCNRQPVVLHGRSYMYGLPDNVIPVPAGICR